MWHTVSQMGSPKSITHFEYSRIYLSKHDHLKIGASYKNSVQKEIACLLPRAQFQHKCFTVNIVSG